MRVWDEVLWSVGWSECICTLLGSYLMDWIVWDWIATFPAPNLVESHKGIVAVFVVVGSVVSQK